MRLTRDGEWRGEVEGGGGGVEEQVNSSSACYDPQRPKRQSASARTTMLRRWGPRQCGIVQELCESRGGHPGLSVLTSLLVSVDVKLY